MADSDANGHDVAVSITDLRALAGSFLMVWPAVERGLDDALARLDAPGAGTPHGIRSRLDRWKALHDAAARTRPDHGQVVRAVFDTVSQALRLRNGIAHGLIGWQARQFAEEPEAGWTYQLNGERETISYGDLWACRDRLGIVPVCISGLSYAALNPDAHGVENIYSDVRGLLNRHT